MARIAQMAGVSNFWSAQVTQDFDKSPFFPLISMRAGFEVAQVPCLGKRANKQTKKTSDKFLDT